MRAVWMWVGGPAVLAGSMLVGCEGSGEMGPLEALSALGEVNQSYRGVQATGDVIEVSTDLTIGDRLEDAAEAIAAFWESQAACSEVTVEGATVTVDYGGLDDPCTYQGRTYAGVTEVAVASTEPGELEVEHDWTGFTNGDITVDGGATVTWSGNDRTRRVQTEHTFTDGDGNTVDVVGDHLSGVLEEGAPFWESGFTLDGEREWTSGGGVWSLTMEGMELRLIDPAPQAGTAQLTSPRDKVLGLTYERFDDTTIQATLTGVRGGDRVYHIGLLGGVEEVE